MSLPAKAHQAGRHFLEDPVTDLVAIGVVEKLEVVDVHYRHRHGHRFVRIMPGGNETRADLEEMPAIVETCEIVTRSLVAQLSGVEQRRHVLRHAPSELFLVERSPHVVICTGFEILRHQVRAFRGGHTDDADSVIGAVATDLANELDTVHARHLVIHHGKFDVGADRKLPQRRFGGGRFCHVEKLLLEMLRKKLACRSHIIHHKYAHLAVAHQPNDRRRDVIERAWAILEDVVRDLLRQHSMTGRLVETACEDNRRHVIGNQQIECFTTWPARLVEVGDRHAVVVAAIGKRLTKVIHA